jgi:hypothetical protein
MWKIIMKRAKGISRLVLIAGLAGALNGFSGDLNNKFRQMSDLEVSSRMLYGEGKNCRAIEQMAIAKTPLNRNNDGKKWNGENNIKDVVLKNGRNKKGVLVHQYSCFNTYNNRDQVENIGNLEKFEVCKEITRKVHSGEYDRVLEKIGFDKATHYYNPDVVKRPYWADKMKELGKIRIGDYESKHIFFVEE